MTAWRSRPAEPVEVLEDEAWEVPKSLDDGAWRAQGGQDGRRALKLFDEEDE